jgi:uncharacterized protein YbcV (DUF1398 family)
MITNRKENQKVLTQSANNLIYQSTKMLRELHTLFPNSEHIASALVSAQMMEHNMRKFTSEYTVTI